MHLQMIEVDQQLLIFVEPRLLAMPNAKGFTCFCLI